MELEYIDRYVKSKSRKFSSNTLKGYASDIKNYITNIMEEKKCTEIEAIKSVTPIMADDFVRDNPSAEGTVNRKLASLTSFFDYMQNTLYVVDKNPFKNIDRYEETNPTPRENLSLEQTQQLIEETYIKGSGKERMYSFSSARTRFMIALMTTTGMRIEEVTEIRFDFLEKVGENYMINIPSRLSKNGQPRRVPICGKTKQYYNEYLIERNKLDVDSDLLILSNKKKKFDRKNSKEAIQKYVKRIGLEKNIGNHSFRHTFRTVATTHNVNEGLICCIGGWSRKSLGNQSTIYLHDTIELDEVKLSICEKILG